MSSRVDVGFSEEFESWQVESPQFPSKIGGKPAWLAYTNFPTTEDLNCLTCKNPMILLCQIYAPYEECEQNFHRTLFIFICKTGTCCVNNSNKNIKVFRSNITRGNEFYSSEPPPGEHIEFDTDRWVKLCNVCGCPGDKTCSKCHETVYCSKEHQTIDWKERHKNVCGNIKTDVISSKHLFPESLIVIESEIIKKTKFDESKEMKKYNQLKSSGKTGTLQDVSEAELDEHACDEDKAFFRFKERTAEQPEQILRYERGGQPLYIASQPILEKVPNCEYCNGPRQFELQVMPQILNVLNETDIDFGILAVYTCKKSCFQKSGYKSEFVFKQDITL